MGSLHDGDLIRLLTQLTLLLLLARALGGAARRLGVPSVIGELSAGLLLGPSMLGALAPAVYASLFPEDGSGPLHVIAWLGVVLLLAVTGSEVDLATLTRARVATAWVSMGSLALPLVGGYALGHALPTSLLGPAADRSTFAAFMAVAVSISALPVLARILSELDLFDRPLGHVTLTAGAVEDAVGWTLLGALAALVERATIDVLGVGLAVGGTVLAAIVLIGPGRVALNRLLVTTARGGVSGQLGAVVVVTFATSAATAALGMEPVVGAFLTGMSLAATGSLDREVRATLERFTYTVLAPVFFATAGLRADLSALWHPGVAGAALTIVAVGSATKVAGGYFGARRGGFGRPESLAVGFGLNARGAMEIVLATVGLRLGILNVDSYTAVLVLAMSTSLAAPWLMKLALARVPALASPPRAAIPEPGAP